MLHRLVHFCQTYPSEATDVLGIEAYFNSNAVQNIILPSRKTCKSIPAALSALQPEKQCVACIVRLTTPENLDCTL